MADLKIDAFPGTATYPSPGLYLGLPVEALDDPAGWIIGANGSAVPYAALLRADQTRDRRITVIDALNSATGFTVGPALPSRPRWKLQILLRTLAQAEAIDDLIAASTSFTISEWPGRTWTVTGQSSIQIQTVPGAAAWWTIDMDVIRL